MDCSTDINSWIADLHVETKERWKEEPQCTEHKRIPNSIPLDKPHWIRVRNVVAVYADMSGSTRMAIREHGQFRTTARIYDAFVRGVVKIFREFEVEHIDIQGDGVLGVWSGGTARYPGLCAAVTAKTFVERKLDNWVKNNTDPPIQIDFHCGMDEYHVHVKRIGMRGKDNCKEVWAGQPVNIAVKLCTKAEPRTVLVSDRLYQSFDCNEIYLSCGCLNGEAVGEKVDLWEGVELEDEEFGFSKGWKLESNWCPVHGSEYCNIIMDRYAED